MFFLFGWWVAACSVKQFAGLKYQPIENLFVFDPREVALCMKSSLVLLMKLKNTSTSIKNTNNNLPPFMLP